MVTYEYRCAADGLFEVTAPMGGAERDTPCPGCGRPSLRAFSAPMLATGDRRRVAAIDRADRTRDEPEVVSSLPPSRGSRSTRPAPLNPALGRLPRP